jgi:hypothetical protein
VGWASGNRSFECMGKRIVAVGCLLLCLCYKLTRCRNMNKDLLWNPQLTLPPRPTISNVQWIAGTQYVTPADIDMLSKFSIMNLAITSLIDNSWWSWSPTLTEHDPARSHQCRNNCTSRRCHWRSGHSGSSRITGRLLGLYAKADNREDREVGYTFR